MSQFTKVQRDINDLPLENVRNGAQEYEEGVFGVKSTPGSTYLSSIQQSKQAASNRISDSDGIIENDGAEDEALMDDEVNRVSEGAYGITRLGKSDAHMFDNIDENEDNEVVGTVVG